MVSKNKGKNFIKRHVNEPERYYLIRKIFIEKHAPKTKKEFDLITMYSNVLINIVFLQCRYSEKTSFIIMKYLKKNVPASAKSRKK